MSATFQKATPRLPITNAARTIDFYTNCLGFSLTLRWPDEAPTFLLLDRGEVRLAFDIVNGLRPPSTESACGFYLETSDVLFFHRSIRDKVKIEWGPEIYSYGRREFAVRDPDGYLIIFTEQTSDPPTCVVD